jgi:hypothetical protein
MVVVGAVLLLDIDECLTANRCCFHIAPVKNEPVT